MNFIPRLKRESNSSPKSYIEPLLRFGKPTVGDCIRIAQSHRSKWDTRIAELEALSRAEEEVDKGLEIQHENINAQIKLLERQAQELAKQGLSGFQEGREKEVEKLRKQKEQMAASVFQTKLQIDRQAVGVLEAEVEAPSPADYKIFHKSDHKIFYKLDHETFSLTRDTLN